MATAANIWAVGAIVGLGLLRCERRERASLSVMVLLWPVTLVGLIALVIALAVAAEDAA